MNLLPFLLLAFLSARRSSDLTGLEVDSLTDSSDSESNFELVVQFSKRNGHHNNPVEAKKRELTLVPRKSNGGDSSFLKRLAAFRSALFYEGERLEKIFDSVLAAGGETHLTKIPAAKWLPIEVYTLCVLLVHILNLR